MRGKRPGQTQPARCPTCGGADGNNQPLCCAVSESCGALHSGVRAGGEQGSGSGSGGRWPMCSSLAKVVGRGRGTSQASHFVVLVRL